MINRALKTSVLLLFCVSLGFAVSEREVESLNKELRILKGYLDDARDTLQTSVSKRWSKKQQYLNQRKSDKEKISDLREVQKNKVRALTRLKEEGYALESTISDEESALEKKQDSWQFLLASFDEIYTKEEKRADGGMPMDLEPVKDSLGKMKRTYSRNRKPAGAISAMIEYYQDRYALGRRVTVSKKVLMPDGGEPQPMVIVRFGNMFAYAMNNSGEMFTVRQTGELGLARFTVETIGSEELVETLRPQFKQWVRSDSVTTAVTFDVMQNRNSKMLVSGEKIGWFTAIQNKFNAGGPVMWPMLGLLLWAIVLIIKKLIQYSIKHKNFEKGGRKLVTMLNENNTRDAYEYAQNHRGLISDVVAECIKHSDWNRAAAEKAVKEIILEEIPRLNKSLATLSVIAGAAPLLGLLGTVTGMINLFAMITEYGTGDPKILAGGISQALVTTQAGLSVAIPIMLVHNYLRNRSIYIQSEIQKHTTRVMNRLWPEREG
ncbi:MAG: MotA/TolQ/ExbB proton channel family protein [Fibrobacterota bacterium]